MANASDPAGSARSGRRHALAIPKRQMKPWHDDRGEVGLDVSERPSDVIGLRRGDQEIDQDSPDAFDLPALPSWIALLVDVLRKPCPAEPL
jgi:hypothetical protein